ncbi:MAG TPA: sensor histidine kinase [Chitinophagales bacterium]|nr:sensor histidine kinase [Chitinophagales bacterium]
MPERNCYVLLQHRKESEYNDFIGKFYHFPKKYLKQLSKPNIEFVYYEPSKRGAGEYFGYGKIEKVFEDKREPGNFFAEIKDFKKFSKSVPFKDRSGKQRETGPGYNATNAVRTIESETLEEICLDGGILLSFQSDIHLVKVLGEQLIASERVGILELVKNSYDAGATYSKVRIEKVKDLPTISKSEYKFNEFENPVIVIEDDGKGMSWNEIENGWLRPASTLKTNIKERMRIEREKAIEKGSVATYERFLKNLKKLHNNRIPLGEKGVGRFATHRLGRNLLIKTKVRDLSYEYVLKINWDEFDKVSNEFINLESIGVSLTRQKPSRNYGAKKSGTQIIIYGGREGFELSVNEIKEINKTLLDLNSPNPNPKIKRAEFEVIFECPQLADELSHERPVQEEFDPIFEMIGIVDDWGKFEYDQSFNPPPSVPMPKEVKKNKVMDLRTVSATREYWQAPENPKLLRKPVCGSFYFHLKLWYRSAPWVEGPFSKDFFDYLDEYGGISVYRDGINVFPAKLGTETDWLELSTRHIKRGLRISYYTMIGNVELEQTINFDVIDKTNREGMIQNRAYNDFTKLIRGAILLLENDVIGKRDEYNKLTGEFIKDTPRLTNVAKTAAEIFDTIDQKYDVPKDPLGILKQLGESHERKTNLVNLKRSLKNLEKSLELIKEREDLLKEHAGFGISIAVVIHEIAKTTANFYHGIAELLKSKKFDLHKVELLKDASSSLQAELKRITPLRSIKNEEPIQFNISKSIRFCNEVFKQVFEREEIEFSYNVNQDFEIYGRYAAVNQVLTNLIDNSVYWLSKDETKINKIQLKLDSFRKTIVFADSGSGIHESILPYLFQPGYSLKFPPSGLGLYICKYYMQDMKADIYLTNEKDRIENLTGAQFTLDFSRNKK